MIQKGFTTYMSPRTISYSDGTLDDNVPRNDSEDAEFNHQLYGSLRKGGAVKFFSKECAGLAAATFSSVFCYAALQGVTRPLLATQLLLSRQEQLAVQRLVELPMLLSFLIGLLSDSYPIRGSRRKAYMVVGLILNTIGTVCIGAIAAYFESLGEKDDRNDFLVVMVIFMTAVASFGCMFTYLCVHTRTIELSQQEPLVMRGSIQASYLVMRRLTSLFTSVFTFLVVGNQSSPNMALSSSLFIMIGITLLPLPVILGFWEEELYSLSTTFNVRSKIIWKIMQQKAVWRTMAFIGFFGLFLSIRFSETTSVIARWAGASKDHTLVLRAISDSASLIVIAAWRYFFMNRLWRSFFILAPIFQIVPALIISGVVAFDASRDRYLYRSVMSLTSLGDGVSVLINIVPLTEIVQEGSEGATVGLVLSLQRLISIFVNTNSQGLFRSDNFYDNASIDLDDSKAHDVVFLTLMLNYFLNSLSIFGLLFLPSQKLDAQQMRMYGGFTKIAASGMVVFAVILLCHSLAINVMTFIPATACARIVGGGGC